MKHNNILPNVHKKVRIKLSFNKPIRKKIRKEKRKKLMLKSGFRPLGLLRPAVRCPTLKYNMKLKYGKGFSVKEIVSAGLKLNDARKMCVAIDRRRRNRSIDSIERNKNRLLNYIERFVKIKKSIDTEAKEKIKENAATGKMNELFPIKKRECHIEKITN